MFDHKNCPNVVHHPHDVGYKDLFSSKTIFLELIHNFIDSDWVTELDEKDIIKVDKSYIAHDFSTKEADLVYQLKLKDGDVIFYILLELQSTVDFQMPFRLLSYMMEIWRDLLKAAPEESSQKDFRLPAIIPIVLYNGKSPWTACTHFKEMLNSHEKFTDYLLDFQYVLLDVNRYDKSELIALSNMIGSIFYLDQKYDIIKEELPERLTELSDVLKTFDYEHFRQLTKWVLMIVCRDVPKEVMEQVAVILEESSPKEVNVMISNIEIALREMREEAKAQSIIQITKNLLLENIPDEIIAKVTELPIDKIKKLRSDLPQ